jgi:hypothetical protein
MPLLYAGIADASPAAAVSEISAAACEHSGMSLFRLLPILLSGCCLMGFAGVAGADDDAEPLADDVRAAASRGEVLPLAKILAIAAQRVPGEVLKIELEREHGVLSYELKILARDGRVRELRLDASRGEVQALEDD